ncbi:TPA: hypothetical protein DCR49_07260 [Candidatus Delongbacteria bacterium]|nr:MAG: hypothetical protein A2Y39_03335 [Candidatus Delongbacteria bacterium GWF2_40_14]HAQ61778.1 hypothetical protein [Candidatus Delongbacteria bacterium]
MRSIHLILLTIIAMVLIQCAKVQKPVEMQVKAEKIYTIEGKPDSANSITPEAAFDLTYAVQTDKDGFLYLRDEKTGSIKVFDKAGKYYSSVASSGDGTDQIKSMDTFFADKDTVYIFDSRTKIKKFLRPGEYVSASDIPYDQSTVPLAVSVLNDSTLLGRVSTLNYSSEPVLINLELALFDRKFNKKMIMLTDALNKEVIQRSYFVEPVFAVNDKYIYTAKRSRDEYRIKLYTHSGEFVRDIVQDYIPVKFSDEESRIIKMSQTGNPHYKDFFEYKLALHDIKTDKYGYLWVQRSDGNFGSDISFDIFDGDRLFLTLSMKYEEIAQNTRWVYLSDQIYVFDHKNDKIDVYDYTIEPAKKQTPDP